MMSAYSGNLVEGQVHRSGTAGRFVVALYREDVAVDRENVASLAETLGEMEKQPLLHPTAPCLGGAVEPRLAAVSAWRKGIGRVLEFQIELERPHPAVAHRALEGHVV